MLSLFDEKLLFEAGKKAITHFDIADAELLTFAENIRVGLEHLRRGEVLEKSMDGSLAKTYWILGMKGEQPIDRFQQTEASARRSIFKLKILRDHRTKDCRHQMARGAWENIGRLQKPHDSRWRLSDNSVEHGT